MESIIFWIIIAAVAIIIDIATSNFLFVWFAVGAIVAMLGSFIGLTFGIQIIIFLVISLITVSLGYPWAKKKFKNSTVRTPLMEEKYIGRVMKAEENILDRAKVKVDGIYWTVVNTGEEINSGDNFKIIGIDGIKLIIKKEGEI